MRPAEWLARFEARREQLAADLEFLVTRESPSEDAARVSLLARGIGDRLRERGVRAETRPCAGRGDALVAEIGCGAGTLLLGHLDTVWRAGTIQAFPGVLMAIAPPGRASST